MKYLYLALSIIGFVVPLYFIVLIGIDHQGFQVFRFFEEITLNNSARLLVGDLSIVALTSFVFIFQQAWQHRVKWWWVSIIGTFLIGLSFGLPFFLYLRQKSLEKTV